jgi:hypothetical protein
MRKHFVWNPRLFRGTHDFLFGTHDFFSGPTTFYSGPTTFFPGPTTFYPRHSTHDPRLLASPRFFSRFCESQGADASTHDRLFTYNEQNRPDKWQRVHVPLFAGLGILTYLLFTNRQSVEHFNKWFHFLSHFLQLASTTVHVSKIT